jgi:hypothetical protein
VLQCGKIDDDEHYYLDTEKDFVPSSNSATRGGYGGAALS